jgi:glyoxylase-like metal-dependent hydrolase (beta-lactamase superfamily II)
MSDDLVFDQTPTGPAGQCATLTPLVRRIVAGNSGPFTFTGTCSYIIGREEVAILDPGPDRPEHVAALLGAVRGERVGHVVVTHTHTDHSPAARAVAAATGASIVGCGPHIAARELADGETNSMEGSGDLQYRPDAQMRERDVVSGPGWTLTAHETPGHTMNHLVFSLAEENAVFSGDHVMGWSTTFIGPPDGSMARYMASLERMRRLAATLYWPGHGGPVREPQRYLRALIHHRRQREAAILARIGGGDRTVGEIASSVYPGLAPALMGAARLSIFAHLEDLVGRGLALTDGPPVLNGEYRPGR